MGERQKSSNWLQIDVNCWKPTLRIKNSYKNVNYKKSLNSIQATLLKAYEPKVVIMREKKYTLAVSQKKNLNFQNSSRIPHKNSSISNYLAGWRNALYHKKNDLNYKCTSSVKRVSHFCLQKVRENFQSIPPPQKKQKLHQVYNARNGGTGYRNVIRWKKEDL